jgi:hypothetical protein
MSDKHQDSLSLPGRCRSCMETWPCEVERLTQERDALAVALAQLREACLEDIGGRHDEIQCAICLGYWPIAGPPQHDATCILAADQPAAAAGAELLAAADSMADFLMASTSVIEVDLVERYRRARAGLRAAEGPGREGE